MSTPVEIHADWGDQLEQGLAAMGLQISAGQRALLLRYLGLLSKWNRAYNLTAVRDPGVMVRRQLLDSLSILPWVDQGPILDVGTGAGLPGVPLSIARPDLAFSLLDTNGKKTRFLNQVVAELGLANIEVIRGRVEQLQRPAHYAGISSRAFATLGDMVSLTGELLEPGGRWLAMKGVKPQAELAELSPGLAAETVELNVPGESGRRNLVILRRTE